MRKNIYCSIGVYMYLHVASYTFKATSTSLQRGLFGAISEAKVDALRRIYYNYILNISDVYYVLAILTLCCNVTQIVYGYFETDKSIQHSDEGKGHVCDGSYLVFKLIINDFFSFRYIYKDLLDFIIDSIRSFATNDLKKIYSYKSLHEIICP